MSLRKKSSQKKAPAKPEIRQIFWDYPGCEVSPGQPGRNCSSMERLGEFIIYEFDDYDGEDRRQYEYRGTFNVEDFKTAILEFQKNGKAEIKGVDLRLPDPTKTKTPVSKSEFRKVTLRLSHFTDYVAITFSGSSLDCSPGGSGVHGSLTTYIELKDLLLKE